MNKKILVTGGSKGLGKEICKKLVSENYEVISFSRTMPEFGKWIKIDFMNDDIKKIPPYKRIFCIIHNIGGTLGIREENWSILTKYSNWLDVWNFNVGIAIKINEIYLPYMMQRKEGKLIFISSDSTTHLKASSPYVCSKSFLDTYCDILQRELDKYSISVMRINPPRLNNMISKRLAKGIYEHIEFNQKI